MLGNYTFRKYTDLYYLKNLDTLNTLSWTLQKQVNCQDYQNVSSGTLIPGSDELQVPITSDGDYNLLLSDGTNSLTIPVHNFLVLQKGLLNNIRQAICGNANNCVDCGEQNLNACTTYQGLFAQVWSYQHFIHPYDNDYYDNTGVMESFIAQAFDMHKCVIGIELYSQIASEMMTGKVKHAKKLIQFIAGIYYLVYYFSEKELAVDTTESNYVDSKFFWIPTQPCLAAIGINVQAIKQLFDTISATMNHAPSVSDARVVLEDLDLNVLQTYTFKTSDFTTNFSDPEGDHPGTVKILENTFAGQLYFNNLLINGENFTFPISQVNNLQYKFTPTETSVNFDSIFFQISDDNVNPKFSNMAKFSISVPAYVNQPPSKVGNNSISVANRATRVFTLADFTTNTTPAYADPENDPVYQLRVDTLPVVGVLKLNGVAVTAGQIIPSSQITSGLFVYVAPSQDAAASVSFNFSLSDTGSHTFVS